VWWGEPTDILNWLTRGLEEDHEKPAYRAAAGPGDIAFFGRSTNIIGEARVAD
jgi:hypothetical protein